MKTINEKRDFLVNSYEQLQGLFFSKVSRKEEKIKLFKETVIEYFLDESIEKTFSGLFIEINNQQIVCKQKQKIYSSTEYRSEIDKKLEDLLNLHIKELPISEKENVCVRVKIKHTNKNFYITRNNDIFSLSWGINQNSVKEICNELKSS